MKNEKSYQFFLNFIAYTFAGRKLRKAIHMQSSLEERTGKGIIINNLINSNVLSERMYKT
jgi:hypothetical protein